MNNLMDLYNNVFDEAGKVKACGRTACSELINACSSLDNSIDFGNSETGIMNVDNIKDFITERC